MSDLSTPTPESSVWPWVSGAFGFLWLTTLLLWWQSNRLNSNKPVETAVKASTDTPNEKAARKRLKEAVSQGDPQQSRLALLSWAATRWPDNPPAGLSDIASRINNQAAAKALAQLDQALYSDQASGWDSSVLLGLLDQLASEDDPGLQDPKTELPPLYP